MHNGPMFFTIPTLMTWTRIVAIPLIVAVYYIPGLTDAMRNALATAAGGSTQFFTCTLLSDEPRRGAAA